MRHPVDKPVFGSGFGPRKAPTPGASTNHLAQDYKAAKGTPVRAIADGTIDGSFHTGPGGWWVHLRLTNGDIWGGCHLREKSPLPIGREVREGDIIAYVGNTGTATTGPHLHATMRVNGVYVDPRKYINDGIQSAPTAPTPSGPLPTPKDDDMDKLVLLISIPQIKDSRAFDWYVQNLADRTVYNVPNNIQVKYLKDLGLRVFENQHRDAIAGFRAI